MRFPEFAQFCIASFLKHLTPKNPLRLLTRPHLYSLLRVTMDHPLHFESAASANFAIAARDHFTLDTGRGLTQPAGQTGSDKPVSTAFRQMKSVRFRLRVGCGGRASALGGRSCSLAA